jgi:hypothetical protein
MSIPLKKKRDFDPEEFLAKAGIGRKIIQLKNKDRAFSQGDPGDSIFYIQNGRIRLSVTSKSGKEATVALLGTGCPYQKLYPCGFSGVSEGESRMGLSLRPRDAFAT